jgi:hypothetical protein
VVGQEKAATDVLVIFGITGDLAKKMTLRSLYRLEESGMLACPIVGVARDDWSDDRLRKHARRAIEGSGEPDGGDRLSVRCSPPLMRVELGPGQSSVATALSAWSASLAAENPA